MGESRKFEGCALLDGMGAPQSATAAEHAGAGATGGSAVAAASVGSGADAAAGEAEAEAEVANSIDIMPITAADAALVAGEVWTEMLSQVPNPEI